MSPRGGAGGREPLGARRLAPVLVGVVALTALAGAGCADRRAESEPSSVPIGLAALTDLASLAELRPPGLRVEQVSSYDRTGGNGDLGVGPDTAALLALLGVPPTTLDNSILGRDGDRHVIFDALGPGVVYRIWMTGLDTLFLGRLDGDIAFELDDEPEPRWRGTRAELFSGSAPPFLAPLAGNDLASSGGFYSVLPIAFERRLRITTSSVPNWLHVTWARLPADTAVTSFDPAADTTAAAAALAATGTDPKGIAADRVVETPLALAPGAGAAVFARDGPGTVLALELLSPPGDEIPTGLRLRATWDDAAAPQIDAPLDDLFGASLGPGAQSLAFGREGDRSYLYLPMPFRERARVAVHNDGAAAVAGWRVRVAAADRAIGRRPGHLHAFARAARVAPDGRDYTLLETTGTGHVVGVVMTAGCAERGGCSLAQTPGLDGSHLEGDERIAIDDSRYPQVHGTGLEDFFSGGFYFIRGPFTLPTHGNPAQAPDTSPRRPGLNLRSMYRLLLGDAIPFRSRVRLAVEHGPTNDVPAEMSSLVLYYAIPEPSLVESDRIALGDAASEAAHALAADGRIERTLTSAFRGDDADRPLTAHGIEAAVTRFRVVVDPDHAAVRLRRLADIGAGAQVAEVRVDGAAAGTWATADVNPTLRFAELDFDLPPDLTRGRDSLAIEIDARQSRTPWTAYGYAALSDLDAPGRR